jgi:broad specificity phosphatase PhoE
MARTIELRRHTDSDGDALSDEGIRAALDIGARLRGGYAVLVSSGAQRATQTLGCFLAALAEKVEGGLVVEPALRSSVEDRWRGAYRRAGSGSLAALRGADPELVQQDAAALADGLRRVLARLPDSGSALAVGHSPTNEAAVFGLTGVELEPMGKGRGVLLIADEKGVRVETLEP